MFGSKQVRTGKNTEIKKQSGAKFWFIKENMELSHIH